MKLIQFINKISPLTWGLTYLMLIPIFAFFYNTFFPYAFYHSTFQNENIFESKNIEIQKDLETTIQTNFYLHNDGKEIIEIDKPKAQVDYSIIEYKNIDYSDGLSFEIELEFDLISSLQDSSKYDNGDEQRLEGIDSSRFIDTTVDLEFQCNIPEKSIEDFISGKFYRKKLDSSGVFMIHAFAETNKNDITTFYTQAHRLDTNKFEINFLKSHSNLNKIDFEICPIDSVDNEYFSILAGMKFPHFCDEYLYVTKDFINNIYGYDKGIKGLPSSVNGNYWRMFYFSAITITTVGYGDIVPITTSARVLVSIEAILGVTLIGLFLNSLANKIRGN